MISAPREIISSSSMATREAHHQEKKMKEISHLNP
jgi:hypothetical protein